MIVFIDNKTNESRVYAGEDEEKILVAVQLLGLCFTDPSKVIAFVQEVNKVENKGKPPTAFEGMFS